MGLFGSRNTAVEAQRRRAALPHQAVLSPAPGTGSEPLNLANAPDTGRARSAATLLALTAAKRQRKRAQAGTGPTLTGRPTSVRPLTAMPRTLIGGL